MITFIINSPNHPYKLELRWNERMSEKSVAAIHAAIDNIHGVERVNMHRYAAEIFYAAHLVDDKILGPAVKAALLEILNPEEAEVL